MGHRIPSRGAVRARGDLTTRETEVLQYLAKGLRNREIGERLYISERTVARHMTAVLSKLGVPTRTAAVEAAREGGLLGDGEGTQAVAEAPPPVGAALLGLGPRLLGPPAERSARPGFTL
jgi:DNA-binding CsgD family transcriptional regulator